MMLLCREGPLARTLTRSSRLKYEFESEVRALFFQFQTIDVCRALAFYVDFRLRG